MFLYGVDTEKMHAGVSLWSVWDVSQSCFRTALQPDSGSVFCLGLSWFLSMRLMAGREQTFS